MSTYNGWTNYETWSIQLEVLDGMDLRDFYDYNPGLKEATCFVEDFVRGCAETWTTGNNMARTMVEQHLAKVNFEEIAQNLLDSAEYPDQFDDED